MSLVGEPAGPDWALERTAICLSMEIEGVKIIGSRAPKFVTAREPQPAIKKAKCLRPAPAIRPVALAPIRRIGGIAIDVVENFSGNLGWRSIRGNSPDSSSAMPRIIYRNSGGPGCVFSCFKNISCPPDLVVKFSPGIHLRTGVDSMSWAAIGKSAIGAVKRPLLRKRADPGSGDSKAPIVLFANAPYAEGARIRLLSCEEPVSFKPLMIQPE